MSLPLWLGFLFLGMIARSEKALGKSIEWQFMVIAPTGLLVFTFVNFYAVLIRRMIKPPLSLTWWAYLFFLLLYYSLIRRLLILLKSSSIWLLPLIGSGGVALGIIAHLYRTTTIFPALKRAGPKGFRRFRLFIAGFLLWAGMRYYYWIRR